MPRRGPSRGTNRARYLCQFAKQTSASEPSQAGGRAGTRTPDSVARAANVRAGAATCRGIPIMPTIIYLRPMQKSGQVAPLTLHELADLPRPGSGLPRELCWVRFNARLSDEGLNWPDDVVEQFLFDHGTHPEFVSQYGQLDLRLLTWSLEPLRAAVLVRATVYPKFRQRIDSVAAALDYFATVYGVRWGWLDKRTWLRAPVMMHGNLLQPGQADLHLVEGHTRIGALTGYLRVGLISAESIHYAWVGAIKR